MELRRTDAADPTPGPPDQLGGLVVVEHAADRAAGGISAALSGIELVALAELGALVGAPEPCPYADRTRRGCCSLP
jgi:hypothetical protein